MEVNYFQILRIDVTFYFSHVQKVVPYVLTKNEKNEYLGPAVKGFKDKLGEKHISKMNTM